MALRQSRCLCGRITDYAPYLSRQSLARQPSPIRALQPLIGIPGMISLGGGMPNPETFPIDQLSFNIKGRKEPIELTATELSTALQYSPTPGLPRLVEWLQQLVIADHNLDQERAEESAICVTTGSQEAFARAAEMLLEPGQSSVLVESPTYSGVLAALYPMAVNIVKVPSDDDGLQPDVLRDTLANWDASKGERPKVLYTVPNGCNPTGASLSLERRRAVYEICREYDVIILEDDPYFYLQYTKPRLPSLFSMDTEGRVLRFDSFSKIVSSGIRMGFVTGPAPLVDRIQLHGQAVSLHASGVSQAILLKLLETWGLNGFHDHVDKVVSFYEGQKRAFFDAAERHLSGLARWNPHVSAGMFGWFETNVPDTKALISTKAVDAKVLLVPGDAFVAPDEDLRTLPSVAHVHKPVQTPYVRAAFSTASPQQMDEALQRLATLLKEA